MEILRFQTQLVFGAEALAYLRGIAGQRVLVVCDPFLVQSGMIEQVLAPLAGNTVDVFSKVAPDPSIDLVTEGVAVYQAFAPEVMVAVGGGSAIDEAKAIRHFAAGLGAGRGRFIAIPTTSGTGSEVTRFAVVTDKDKGVKYPLVDTALLPDVAILATELVRSVPPKIVADTGMDVLTHAIEAYVSTRASAFSDALAEKAVAMVFAYLHRSYSDPADQEARERMHYASALAGMAFDQASLGLNHAMAHVIGGRLGIPHGRVNSVLLPQVILFNSGLREAKAQPAAERYAYLARVAGLTDSTSAKSAARALVQEIVRLQKALDMPLSLSQCGLSRERLSEVSGDVAAGALLDGCYATNPRQATAEEIAEIYRGVC